MDHRYELIRVMYEDGHIEKLSDIFKFIPKTVVARDAGMNVERMNERLKSPGKWILRQVFKIGELCELTEAETAALLAAEVRAKKT